MLVQLILLTACWQVTLQKICSIEVETLPYSDCVNDFWTNVTFHFNNDEEVFVSPIVNVCDPASKKFSVDVQNYQTLMRGNLGLTQNELGNQLVNPDYRKWYLESVTVDCQGLENKIKFEIDRVVESSRTYWYKHYDTSVAAGFCEQQSQEIAINKLSYEQTKVFGYGPLHLKRLPRDDKYEFELRGHLLEGAFKLSKFGFVKKFINTTHTSTEFSSIEEIKRFWDDISPPFPKPMVEYWDNDEFFVAQRVQGIVPDLIEKSNFMTVKNKHGFKLSKDKVKKITNQDAKKVQLYIVNLDILDGIEKIWSPMALFYQDKDKKLKPLSIQLTRHSTSEQVFYSDDEPNAWNLAKLFYNGAEAIYLQSIRHLGTHMLLDRIGVLLYKHVSPSHPVFKIMKQHLYMMFGNNLNGVDVLLSKGGFFDQMTSIDGPTDAVELLQRGISKCDYRRMNPVTDNSRRKMQDLPLYPYRDRGLDIFAAIRSYVKDVLKNYYGKDERANVKDRNMKEWRIMLGKDPSEYGAGIKKLPGNDRTGVMKLQGLIDIVATFIYQATVTHSSLTNGLYDMHAFTPNYPLQLRTRPPTSKVNITESDFLNALPDKTTTYKIGSSMIILSYDIGNKLGDFKKQFLQSPDDQAAVDKFRKTLADLKTRDYPSMTFPYTWINVNRISNSIDV